MDLPFGVDVDLDRKANLAARFDRFAGPGVLVFEAILAAEERKSDARECLRVLEWHLRLIERVQAEDAVAGWIRFSPLAAQAIRLRQGGLAARVLKRAASLAGKTGSYAEKIKGIHGFEWLLHLGLGGVLLLEQRRPDKAAQIFRHVVNDKYAVRMAPVLRAFQCYLLKASGRKLKPQEVTDCRVGAMNAWAETHASYLPGWDREVWGR